MSIPILTLATDKNSTTVDADRITIRQSEAGLVINANIIDADNNAYNLTNCKVFFGENKDGGKMVDDEDVEIVDRIGGQIKYKLNTAVYQESGDAWFEITDNVNKLIDTTTNFHIDVIKQANLPVENENYWSRAESMLIHVKAFVQKVENDFNSNISNNDSQLNDFVKKFNQQLENYQKELADYDGKYQKLSNDWTNELSRIKANANDQLSSLKSDYDNQKKAIQSVADNQLSANKTVSEKAIAQIETDKQAAIKQANTDFQAKLASIQSDYNTWKANAIDDFQSQINKLAAELKNSEDDQAKLQQAIDSANKAIANINNVDFTKFAHLSDLENYYDKATMDQKLAQAGKLKQISINGGDPINPGADGVAKLNIPQPDLSGLETKADAKTAHDTLTADIAKRILSINEVTADKDGKVVLPDFNHPTQIFKDAKVDPNTLTTTGIYELKNSDLQISLDSLPGFTQTNATYGYILVVNNAALDNTFQVIICRQMHDFILDYRYINKTYNDYPKFNRVINTQDLSNVQNQMTEIKQSMMKSWTGTLAQYQALTNYDPMTMYFIISDYEVVVK
ncbi:BppU family phage baseplate upper protein [Lactobacillus sp.]|uniref:BppU family phage baseplate upper protein n=1 Tax=Lactobacillus sp. TaxID=1591 RepID=UPI00258F64C1|nr:BppU family phage baseplate upper protein [Lactobacillus sp.]MCO6528994.1 BppU family phage baseplate upper protein [Lactobacillus sp.]MCO6530593.1 BppU family phage baseplate upper protein [Lactobacillus sp.]